MPVIKSVIKKEGKNGAFWICVIDGEEVLAFDSSVVAMEGKECPHPILPTKSGDKKFIAFPKAGGFQKGGAGGGWKGKSDREIFSTILTMSMAYAKDLVVAEINAQRIDTEMDVQELCLSTYGRMSKLILADLAKLVPDAPKQTEASKTETKAPEKPPQETSPPKAGTDTGTLSAKDNLKAKMKAYLKARNADTDNAFRALLTELTEFPGKDRDTGELTGKMVYIDDIDDKKFSDKWALTSYGKLKKLIEEEERKGANDMKDEDIPF